MITIKTDESLEKNNSASKTIASIISSIFIIAFVRTGCKKVAVNKPTTDAFTPFNASCTYFCFLKISQ